MATAMVMDPNPSTSPPPTLLPTFPSPTPSSNDDVYTLYKSLQSHLEFLDIKEEYIKEELKNLKREQLRSQEEVKRILSVPLVIGQFLEMIDENYGIVGSTAGSNYYVRILSTINRELLKPSASVLLSDQFGFITTDLGMGNTTFNLVITNPILCGISYS